MTELSIFFKSVIDQDTAAVVICDVAHTIVYMNPAAVSRYEKWGGAALLGRSLLDCHGPESCKTIAEVLRWFEADNAHNIVHTFYNEKEHKDVYMVALRDESQHLIGYYEKHEYRDRDLTPMYDLSLSKK